MYIAWEDQVKIDSYCAYAETNFCGSRPNFLHVRKSRSKSIPISWDLPSITVERWLAAGSWSVVSMMVVTQRMVYWSPRAGEGWWLIMVSLDSATFLKITLTGNKTKTETPLDSQEINDITATTLSPTIMVSGNMAPALTHLPLKKCYVRQREGQTPGFQTRKASRVEWTYGFTPIHNSIRR